MIPPPRPLALPVRAAIFCAAMMEWLQNLFTGNKAGSGDAPMKPKKRDALGDRGENVAARYLRNLGYKIIIRNFRCDVGEIDIVARDGSMRSSR
jgi:hypothetical protein